MRNALLLVLIIFPFVVTGSLQVAQPGATDVVRRNFIDATDAEYGLIAFTAWVAQYETPEAASTAIPAWLARNRDVGDEWDASRIRPIAVEPMGDEIVVQTGVVTWKPSGFDKGRLALVAIRVESRLYLYSSWAYYSDPVDIAIDVARQVLGLDDIELAPVPYLDYQTGGLWDALPRLEMLPTGMTWEDDYRPCSGRMVSSACPGEATPMAPPVT